MTEKFSSIDSTDEAAAVVIHDGRIVEAYCEPAVNEYLKEHKADVERRAHWQETVQKMGSVGLFGELETDVDPLTLELMRIWDMPDKGKFTGERHHNHQGIPGILDPRTDAA